MWHCSTEALRGADDGAPKTALSADRCLDTLIGKSECSHPLRTRGKCVTCCAIRTARSRTAMGDEADLLLPARYRPGQRSVWRPRHPMHHEAGITKNCHDHMWMQLSRRVPGLPSRRGPGVIPRNHSGLCRTGLRVNGRCRPARTVNWVSAPGRRSPRVLHPHVPTPQ